MKTEIAVMQTASSNVMKECLTILRRLSRRFRYAFSITPLTIGTDGAQKFGDCVPPEARCVIERAHMTVMMHQVLRGKFFPDQNPNETAARICALFGCAVRTVYCANGLTLVSPLDGNRPAHRIFYEHDRAEEMAALRRADVILAARTAVTLAKSRRRALSLVAMPHDSLLDAFLQSVAEDVVRPLSNLDFRVTDLEHFSDPQERTAQEVALMTPQSLRCVMQPLLREGCVSLYPSHRPIVVYEPSSDWTFLPGDAGALELLLRVVAEQMIHVLDLSAAGMHLLRAVEASRAELYGSANYSAAVLANLSASIRKTGIGD